jgi:hypothetical protein
MQLWPNLDLPPSLDAYQTFCRFGQLTSEYLDQRVSNATGPNPDIREDWLVRIRVLGREALSILATEHVATEINSCVNHVQLYH